MRSRKSRNNSWNLGRWGWGRGLLAIALILVGTGGIAYGLLISHLATLKGNTIETSLASLLVSADGTNFSNSLDGYFFGGLMPGGQPMPTNGYPVYLKNVGTIALTANLSVPSGFSNPNNLDLGKVHVILQPIGAGTSQSFTLQALMDGAASGGVPLTGTAAHLGLNQVVGYNMQIQLDSDALSGPSATLTNLEFDFGGTAVN
ncbi:MAG TPA: hypothetical protein VHB51_04060 [Candidatus Saccharimonadales bacterium]|nr:hypothetical protein [Candidatus Saccharimonadales bacterium]